MLMQAVPDSENPAVYLIFGTLLLMVFLLWKLLRFAWRLVTRPVGKPGRAGSLLDTVLMQWNNLDILSLKDLLNGGVIVFGRPGSGKSSSSFFQLLWAVVRRLPSGGLILAASPGDRAMVMKVFKGLEHRLVIFDERSRACFNAISFILTCGGSSQDILMAIELIFESVNRGGGQGGEGENSFFVNAAKRLLFFSIVMVKHATNGASPADLIGVINTAATKPQEWHSDEFKKSLHFKLMQLAVDNPKSASEAFDMEGTWDYFSREFPQMSERTRASVVAVAMNYLHPFNTGMNRQLFATSTNVSPAVMDQGKWVFVDMPISRCGVEGAFAIGVWKFVTEWYTLRRHPDAENTPLFIAVDEFQNSINAYDAHYLGECRKFRSCMIACTQSKASFLANMGGQAAEAKVDSVLNNFTHKIFHALGDVDTATWASDLVGKAPKFLIGGAEQPGDVIDRLAGMAGWGGNMNEQMLPIMEPGEFMYGLRTGGPRNGNLCDAVLVRSGELFESTQQGVLRLTIPQS